MKNVREELIHLLTKKISHYYGDQLLSFALFGSSACGKTRLNSDLDILLIVKRPKRLQGYTLPKRNEEFILYVELPLESFRTSLYQKGLWFDLSPIILLENEAKHFNPIYMDMVKDRKIIIDHTQFLANILKNTKKKMKKWGSRKLWYGGHWSWEIKPGMLWNEVLDYDK